MAKTTATSDLHQDEGRQSHDPNPTQLDEAENHKLAEHRKIVGRTSNGKTGDAQGARRSEASVEKRQRVFAGSTRPRHRQRDRSEGDHPCEP